MNYCCNHRGSVSIQCVVGYLSACIVMSASYVCILWTKLLCMYKYKRLIESLDCETGNTCLYLHMRIIIIIIYSYLL